MIDSKLELMSDALGVSMATLQDAMNDDDAAIAKVFNTAVRTGKEMYGDNFFAEVMRFEELMSEHLNK